METKSETDIYLHRSSYEVALCQSTVTSDLQKILRM